MNALVKRFLIIGIIIASAALTTGCGAQIPTPEEYTRQAIGKSIDVILEAAALPESYPYGIAFQERTYVVDNGNTIYVTPDSPGCEVHWEVDSSRTIVGARWDGPGCH